MNVSDAVRDLLAPALATHDLELVDVEHRANLLRVTVDRPGGVDLEAVSATSRLVSDELDRHDIVPGRYVLEVSSPGVERPLRTPEHFAHAVGSTVAVRTHPGAEGDRRVQGVLEAADDGGVVVAGRRLSYADVERARTVFEWGSAPRTKAKAKPKARPKPGPKATAVTP